MAGPPQPLVLPHNRFLPPGGQGGTAHPGLSSTSSKTGGNGSRSAKGGLFTTSRASPRATVLTDEDDGWLVDIAWKRPRCRSEVQLFDAAVLCSRNGPVVRVGCRLAAPRAARFSMRPRVAADVMKPGRPDRVIVASAERIDA
jgi:hypothetical protein